jgi:CheY-like chemotaxis protein
MMSNKMSFPKVLRILVIDDDQDFFTPVSFLLKNLGYKADYARNFEEAREKLEEAQSQNILYDLVTIDNHFKVKYPSSREETTKFPLGRHILQQIKAIYPQIACLMISGEVITPEYALDLRDDYNLDYFLSKTLIFDENVMNSDVMNIAIQRAMARVENARPRCKVFLSYRRSGSWGQARAIANSLRERNVDVFLDFDSINQGRFDSVIDAEIRRREFFVPLLTKNTFESEWVQREINKALVLQKMIVPLLIDDFSFETTPPPPIIDDLKMMAGIRVEADSYEDALDRLVNRFLVSK